MRPLRYYGRLPRSGLRLLDIFVEPTLACYRLVGVVERPLGPRRHICQVRGGNMGAPVLGALGGGALSSAEIPGGGGGALSSAGGGAGGAPPGLARGGVETPPSPMELGPSSSLREPASRPSRLVRPGEGVVLCILSRHRNPPPVVPPVSSHEI